MAYQNKISILIVADDQATAVMADVAASAEEQQTALAAAVEDSNARQAESSSAAADEIDASQTSISEAVGRTEAAFVSLGATSDEYSANMAIIAQATTEAEGGITVLGDDAQATKDIILSSNDEIMASYRDVAATTDTSSAETAAASDGLSNKVGIGAGVIAAAVAVGVGAMVKSAGDYQAALTRLVTSAGESEDNLQVVGNGILQVAQQTGTATTALTAAMYTIESGGFHAADGLEVLTAVAQGAKTENADLATVADAVTSAMTDYHLSASQAADVTSKLVAATGQGKTTFQDLAGAMSALLPKASAAGISLNEVLGDLASMTLHGISAQQASENLADAISHLQSPTQAMSKEMAALGLNSTELSQNLGQEGLSGTIGQISASIQKQMGPDSTAVILNMENALQGLPQSVQQVSQEVINGSASWSDWNSATKDLTVTQKAQAQAFATLYNGMHTIGTEQMSGAQVMQTYSGAMNKAMGDSAGLNVALMLTGQNTQNTTNAIKAVSDASAEAGNNVKGWSDIQGNFNQQMSVLKETVGTTAIEIGQALLPPLTSLAEDITGTLDPLGNWIKNNKDLTAGILLTVGGLTAFVAITWAAQKATSALGSSFSTVTTLGGKFAESLGLLDGVESKGTIKSIGSDLMGVAGDAGGATEAIAGGGGLIAGITAIGVALAAVGTIYAAYKIGTAIGNDLNNSAEGAVAGAAPVNLNDGGAGYNPNATYSASVLQTNALQDASNTYKTAVDNLKDSQKQQTTATQDVTQAQKAVKTAQDDVTASLGKYVQNSPQYIKVRQDLATASQNLNQMYANEATTSLTVMSNAYKTGAALQSMETEEYNLTTLGPAINAQLDGTAGKIATIGVNATNAMTPISNLQGGLTILSTAWSGFYGGLQSQIGGVNQILMESGNEITTLQGQNDKLNASLQSTVGSINAITNGGKGTGTNISGSLTGGSTGITIKGALAGGTNYSQAGTYLVGEQGPELVNLPSGAQVMPAGQTSNMMGGAGKSVVIQNLNVYNNTDAGMVARQIGWQLAMA